MTVWSDLGLTKPSVVADGAPDAVAAFEYLLDLSRRVVDVTDPRFAGGALGNDIADDLAAIEAARDAAGPGGVLVFPGPADRIYRTTGQLDANVAGQHWVSLGTGRIFQGPTIHYDGAVDATKAVVKVAAGTHGVTVEGLILDAGLKAGIAGWVDVVSGSATHRPTFRNCHAQGYTSRGWVFGGNSTTVANTGQMQNAMLDNCSWMGGSAGAIGLLLNAQNCEWLTLTTPYFDPDSGGSYNDHLNHIFALRGGLNVTGLLTTRSTGYAIESYEQVNIAGWRAEDRYLLRTNAVDPGGPIKVSGVQHRDAGACTSADATFYFKHANQPAELSAALVQGSVQVGATSAINVDVRSVKYNLGGGVVFDGPTNARGGYHDIAVGDWMTKGTAPKIHGRMNDSTTDAWSIAKDQVKFGKGAGAYDIELILDALTSQTAALEFKKNSTSTWWLYQPGSDGGLYIRDITNAKMQVSFNPGSGAGGGDATFNCQVKTPATTAAHAGLNLPHGTVPSAPNDGDVWTTSAGLFVRINGVTVGPLS